MRFSPLLVAFLVFHIIANAQSQNTNKAELDSDLVKTHVPSGVLEGTPFESEHLLLEHIGYIAAYDVSETSGRIPTCVVNQLAPELLERGGVEHKNAPARFRKHEDVPNPVITYD